MRNNLLDTKSEFRKKQFLLRKKLFSSTTQVFNKNLFEKLCKVINFESKKVVSSFMSIKTEINTNKLNNFILKKNKKLCLPVVIKKNKNLVFRQFTNDQDMVEGFMKIKEPKLTNKILIPEILFIPCLAFDDFGYRLGYGGGYYDRTLNNLKKINQNFLSIGYAFDGQKVPHVPIDKFDIKLDYVITEKNIYSFV